MRVSTLIGILAFVCLATACDEEQLGQFLQEDGSATATPPSIAESTTENQTQLPAQDAAETPSQNQAETPAEDPTENPVKDAPENPAANADSGVSGAGAKAPSKGIEYLDFSSEALQADGVVASHRGFEFLNWDLWAVEAQVPVGVAPYDEPAALVHAPVTSISGGHAAGYAGFVMRREDGGAFDVHFLLMLNGTCAFDEEGPEGQICVRTHFAAQGFVDGEEVFRYDSPPFDAFSAEPFFAPLRFSGIDELRIFNTAAETSHVDLIAYTLRGTP